MQMITFNTYLEVLRGASALIVVLYHSSATLSENGVSSALIMFIAKNGAIGVDIFFVLSGYLMGLKLSQPATQWSNFLFDRFIRICPSYFLCTFVMLLLLIFLPSGFDQKSFSFFETLLSFSFMTTFTNSKPLIYVGWSLELELYFYLVCAIAIKIKKWINEFYFILIICILLSFITNQPILIELCYGFVLSRISVAKFNKPACTIFSVIIAVGFFLISNLEEWDRAYVGRQFTWGVSAFFLVLSCIIYSRNKKNVFCYLGRISFCLYLVQVFTLPLTFKVCQYLDVNMGAYILIITMSLSLLAAVLLYEIWDNPIRGYIRHWRG